MRQIWISKSGGPQVLTLREVPKPIPASGEVRIKVQTAGVSFADVMARLAAYPGAPSPPFVPGLEVAGEIDAVGQGVSGLATGDAVLAATAFGGYGEMVCVPYQQAIRRPGWMNAKDAAALPANYILAYVALYVIGSVRPGDKVLIHSAAGGTGLAALDICHIVGAETFGTASLHKHDFLRQRGLDHAINYRQEDYERQIRKIIGNRGLDIVLDPLGGGHWKKNARLLAPTGRHIMYGNRDQLKGEKLSRTRALTGRLAMPSYAAQSLMGHNRAVAGINLVGLWSEHRRLRGWFEQLIQWYDEALFRPHIDQTFPLHKAAEAHHYLQSRESIGKVLLTMG